MLDAAALRSAADAVLGHVGPDVGAAIGHRIDRGVRRRFWALVERQRSFIAESEKWPVEQLERYQVTQLHSVLHHAYDHVPYYRARLDEAGVRPDDVRTIGDLQQLPTLRKRDLQEHLDDLLATTTPPRKRKYHTTGGSTGIPVGFYHDRGRTSALEWAFMTSQWRRVGYRDGDRSAVMRGTPVQHGIWHFDALRNNLLLSSYHMTDDRLPEYLDLLRKFRPKYIQAYPSSITLVARFMRLHDEPPLEGVEAILCGSENLYDWQRAELARAFRCRVFSWYGQSECVCLAGECEHDDRLHIFPQYGVTELVDEEDNVVTEPGQLGEIVATGFLSRVMPLIRYRTADLASYAEGSCHLCGRPYRLFERIEGRLQEFIITAAGRHISMAAINMHTPIFDNVQQFRFFQDTPGVVVFRFIPKPTYTPADETGIRAELAPKLGDDVTLVLERVEEIRPTPRGKHHFLDQRLTPAFGDHRL
jgi:phenylacetate-CoA ligase